MPSLEARGKRQDLFPVGGAAESACPLRQMIAEQIRMRQIVWVLTLAAGFWPVAAGAQSGSFPSETAATKPAPPPQLLGANFTPVPEVLYSQVPALPKGQGLLIDTVGK